METLEQQIQRLIREEIAIAPYDAQWPQLFEEEKTHLLQCLPAGLIERIEHFGSTAVPGLAAKPIIDILVGVTSLSQVKQEVVPTLLSQGYEYIWRPTVGEDGPPWYAWFIKRDPKSRKRTHHIHMIEGRLEGPFRFEDHCRFEGHWDRLYFRDYLREYPQVARQYEELKRSLAAQHSNNRVQYTTAKSDFVARVTDEAKRKLADPRSE